jgi:hypothetical protein
VVRGAVGRTKRGEIFGRRSRGGRGRSGTGAEAGEESELGAGPRGCARVSVPDRLSARRTRLINGWVTCDAMGSGRDGSRAGAGAGAGADWIGLDRIPPSRARQVPPEPPAFRARFLVLPFCPFPLSSCV